MRPFAEATCGLQWLTRGECGDPHGVEAANEFELARGCKTDGLWKLSSQINYSVFSMVLKVYS